MSAKASPKTRKKIKRVVNVANIYIKASFNNTFVTITDLQGNVLVSKTAGKVGFKNSRKNSPYAAQKASEEAALVGKGFGIKSVAIFVQGPGPGREAAMRVVSGFFEVAFFADITGVPYNGCRPPKERRV